MEPHTLRKALETLLALTQNADPGLATWATGGFRAHMGAKLGLRKVKYLAQDHTAKEAGIQIHHNLCAERGWEGRQEGKHSGQELQCKGKGQGRWISEGRKYHGESSRQAE